MNVSCGDNYACDKSGLVIGRFPSTMNIGISPKALAETGVLLPPRHHVIVRRIGLRLSRLGQRLNC